MSQKSSVPQVAKSVSQALMSDTPLCSSVPLNGPTAICVIKFYTSGIHKLTAAFSGTNNYAPSVSLETDANLTDQRIKTTQTIGKFMGRRSDLIGTNGPDDNRQINRLGDFGGTGDKNTAPAQASGFSASSSPTSPVVGPDASDMARLRFGGHGHSLADAIETNGAGLPSETGFPGEGQSGRVSAPGSGLMGLLNLQGNTDGPTRFSFATSLRDITRSSYEAEARREVDAGVSFAGGPGRAGGSRPNPFDIWIAGTYTSFRDPGFASNQDGHFGLITVGADYVVNRSLLIGALIQFDSMGGAIGLASLQG